MSHFTRATDNTTCSKPVWCMYFDFGGRVLHLKSFLESNTNLLLVLKTSEKLVACFFPAAEAWKSSKKLGKQLNTKLKFPVEVLCLKVWWVMFRTQQWCHKECSYCRHYQTEMYHRRFPRSKMVPVRKLFHDINILSFESKKDIWAVF